MKGKIVERIKETPWNEVFFVSVKLDNGDAGQLYAKSSGLYPVGEEIEYDLDTSKGDGKHSIKIKKPFNAGGFPKKEWKGEDIEFKTVSVCMSYVKDLVVAGKIELKDMSTYTEKMSLKTMEIYQKLKANKTADVAV